MSNKSIPNGHSDFAAAARSFAQNVANEPARFAIAQEDSDALSEAMKSFDLALQKVSFPMRSTGEAGKIMRAARKEVETIWRPMRHAIRANPRVDAISKSLLKLDPPKRPTKVLTVPMEPPDLRFRQALHAGASATPMHELTFWAAASSKMKPEGAVRLELFIDLIGVEEDVPGHPGGNHAGRPWYFRSYVKSPIVLAPPMPRTPMIMLYWARWADAQGNVGPFCQTVVSPIVGGMRRFHLAHFDRTRNPIPMMEDKSENRDVTIRIAVMEMQRQIMSPTMLPSVEVPETKQLEGPDDDLAKVAA